MRSTYTICAIVTIALSFFYSDAQGMKRTPKQVGKGLYEIVRASSGVPRSSSTGAPVITRVVTRATEATSSHSPQQRMNPSFTGNPLPVLKASPVAEVHPKPKTSQHSYLLESRVDKRLKRDMCTDGQFTVEDKDRNICARIQKLHSDGVNVAKICDIVEKEFPECKNGLGGHHELINHAASKGYINTVSLLLDKGVDMMDRIYGDQTTTPLLEAIRNKQHNIVQLLLDRGVTINITNKSRENAETNPLIVALESNDVKMFRLLMDHGADVNMDPTSSYYSYYKYYKDVHKDIRKDIRDILVSHFSHNENTQKRKFSKRQLSDTLEFAAKMGLSNVVHILCEIKSSAGEVILNHEDKKEALIHAAAYSNINVVKYFLDHHGFDTETRDQWGNTLLSIAKQGTHAFNRSRQEEDLMNFLLDRGANIEARNKLGQTPLMIQNTQGYGDIDHLKGPEWDDPNPDYEKFSQLFDCPLTSLLISRGANIEATDNEGNTALFHASHSYVLSNMAITLLNAGANADHRNKDGITPLMQMEFGYFKWRDIGDMKKQKIYTDLSSSEKCRFIICNIFGRNYVSKS